MFFIAELKFDYNLTLLDTSICVFLVEYKVNNMLKLSNWLAT